jgi:hypothetical protein
MLMCSQQLTEIFWLEEEVDPSFERNERTSLYRPRTIKSHQQRESVREREREHIKFNKTVWFLKFEISPPTVVFLMDFLTQLFQINRICFKDFPTPTKNNSIFYSFKIAWMLVFLLVPTIFILFIDKITRVAKEKCVSRD